MPRSRKNRPAALRGLPFGLLAVVALLLGACGSDSGGAGTTAAPDDALSGEITVSAAASLTESFDRIAEAFQEANPNTTVTLSYGSSDALADQIVGGAPVDVFASASQTTTDKVTGEDLVDGEPTTFARNQLIIVTKPGNPEGIETLADLADVGVVALCGEEVPCGRFADQVLTEAGVTIPEGNVTRGENVKATLTAVTDGDAVAAIVYVTDAIAAGDAVTAVDLPEGQNAIATYPISLLTDAANPEVGQAFIDFVLGDEGQAVLEEAGFLAPA